MSPANRPAVSSDLAAGAIVVDEERRLRVGVLPITESGTVVLGVIDGEVPDPVAVGFDDHDGAFGQDSLDPGEDLEERVDACVDRVLDAAQQQAAWPGCAGQRQDGADVGVRGDQDALVSDTAGGGAAR